MLQSGPLICKWGEGRRTASDCECLCGVEPELLTVREGVSGGWVQCRSDQRSCMFVAFPVCRSGGWREVARRSLVGKVGLMIGRLLAWGLSRKGGRGPLHTYQDAGSTMSALPGRDRVQGRRAFRRRTRAKSRALLAMTLTKQGTNCFRTCAF